MEVWYIAYKVKFLLVVNWVAARSILVRCLIQVETLPPRGPSVWQYSNLLAVNRCVKRCPIPGILNFGCAKILELATENETPIKAKKPKRNSF